ncbi:MAG: TonB-dependent receptor, partial [Pedobacter sp.]
MNKINNVPRCIVTGILYGILLFYVTTETVFAQQDSLRRIRKVDVSAKILPQLRKQLPSQFISQKDFIKYNAINVADAIRSFSGVNIRDYGGIGGLKTVSVRSLGANHTGVLYNGIQLNDAQNGQVDLGRISLDPLESIELSIAQLSVQLQTARAYSFGSVISLTTAKPTVSLSDKQRLNAFIKAGSFGYASPGIRFEQHIHRDISLMLNTSFSTANGKYKYKINGDGSDSYYERSNGDLNAYRADAQLYILKDSLKDLSINANYFASNNGLPGAIIFYNDHSAQRSWTDEWFVHAKYEQKIGSIQLLFNTKFAHNYLRYMDPEFLNQQRMLDQRYLQREYYQSAAVSFNVSKPLSFSYSADGVINTLETNLYQFAYPTRVTILQALNGRYDRESLSVNATLLHTHITERVKLGGKPGPRTVFSPAIVMSIDPFNDGALKLRFFYKEIFRAPSFNDLYYTRVGNVNLKPENTQQFNVGAVYVKPLSGRFSFISITADAYYNNITDKIIAVPNKDLFSWSMYNLGRVDIRGVDVTIKTAYNLTTQT